MRFEAGKEKITPVTQAFIKLLSSLNDDDNVTTYNVEVKINGKEADFSKVVEMYEESYRSVLQTTFVEQETYLKKVQAIKQILELEEGD